MFDNQCYATTPSSSNGNSDQEPGNGYGGRRHQHHQHQQTNTPTPGSPTSRLLLEYEMHLRNTLAKGMDAESYSLHTFEALLSQSMENLGNQRSLTNVKFEKKRSNKNIKINFTFSKNKPFLFLMILKRKIWRVSLSLLIKAHFYNFHINKKKKYQKRFFLR
jgi:hypothetical protein